MRRQHQIRRQSRRPPKSPSPCRLSSRGFSQRQPQSVEAAKPETAEAVADIKAGESEASAGADAEPASDDTKP